MQSILTRLSIRFLTCFALMGCGSQTQSRDVQKSKLHFLEFGPNVLGLSAQVKKPTLRICLNGDTGSSLAEWEDKIKRSVLSWVRPLRALTSDELVKNVEVTTSGSECDATVNIVPGAWAVTSIGNQPSIRLNSGGYFSSFNVTLHEFGHAFSLSDTYQNGKSGDCKPGQPQSVMCNTSFDDLREDDIAGVTSRFELAFPNEVPNPNKPDENAGNIKIALSEQDTLKKVTINFSFESPQDLGDGSMSYCFDSKENCDKNKSWSQTISISAPTNVSSKLHFFASKDLNVLRSGALTARYQTPKGDFTQSVMLEAR
jgi:hypothetical protein